MLMTTERRPAIRTLRDWAISLPREAGAIREGEEHGWMQDRNEPSKPPATIRRQASLPMRPWPRYGNSWTRSATPAPSARPTSWPRGS
jgi:hypothetical protein